MVTDVPDESLTSCVVLSSGCPNTSVQKLKPLVLITITHSNSADPRAQFEHFSAIQTAIAR
jgi:hypothetical protein